jgi:hypothetical protein
MSKQSPAPASYADLRALFINTTLKRAPEPSHTETLMTASQEIMKAQGVAVEHVRAADFVLAPGVQPDMTEHGFEKDDWPGIFARVKRADILVIGTPIWLGVLYALQHLGCTIPPQADAGWIGEAGPGPSYGDPRDDGSRVGFDNEFTQRNTTFMTWNLLHMARLLKDAGGLPAHGNRRAGWDAGQRFDHPNPEYR